MSRQWVLLRANDAKDGEFGDWGEVVWIVPPHTALSAEQSAALFGASAGPSYRRAKPFPRVIIRDENEGDYRALDSRPENGYFLELVSEKPVEPPPAGVPTLEVTSPTYTTTTVSVEANVNTSGVVYWNDHADDIIHSTPL